MMTIDRPRMAIEGSPLENIIEGFKFVVQSGPVRALMLLLGLVSFTAMPYAVLMPLFADKILHGGAQALGLLMGCSGVGALCGAVDSGDEKEPQGAEPLGSSFMRRIWRGLADVFLFADCFGFPPCCLSGRLLHDDPDGLLQHTDSEHGSRPPPRTRDVRLCHDFYGDGPLGALLAGSLAHKLGAPMTVGIGGVVAIMGAAVFGSKLPAIRPAAREMIVAQQMAGGAPAQEMTGRVFTKNGDDAVRTLIQIRCRPRPISRSLSSSTVRSARSDRPHAASRSGKAGRSCTFCPGQLLPAAHRRNS